MCETIFAGNPLRKSYRFFVAFPCRVRPSFVRRVRAITHVLISFKK